MKKLITAVLLTAFCLQTAGGCAQAAAIPVPAASTGSRSSAAQTTTAQTQATASQIQTKAETKTTQNTQILEVAFIDLLSKYGYDSSTIASFLRNQQKINREEFEQICKNIEIISNNKKLASGSKYYLVKSTPWDNLSKPIAPSFIKLVELDQSFRNFRAYMHNEEKMSVILQNYILLQNTGVLDKYSCRDVIRTMDWESFNGTNYALRLTNLMKETKLYTKDDINKIVSALYWGQIKNDPPASSKAIIQKGYIKYLSKMKGEIPVNNTVLSNFEKILDLMKQNNIKEEAITTIMEASDWTKSDETLTILQILIKNNKKAKGYYRNRFWDKGYSHTVYNIYESVQGNSEIADKDKEFIEQFERIKRARDSYERGDKVGDVIDITAAVITAPVWLTLTLLIFGGSTDPH